MHLALSGVFLLLGEDKYYLSLAYYHFYPFFKGYTCKNKFFEKITTFANANKIFKRFRKYAIISATLQSKEGP